MSEKTKIICIGCPKGCTISVFHQDKTIEKIEGYQCKNGLAYARDEFTAPRRVLTSTVKIEGGTLAMLPVKTVRAIPKEKLFDCAKKICTLRVNAPVTMGTVICSDLCGTDVDLVATRDVAAAK
ncbi:MAG: DUF1667 domain-containing protein [Eubacteriaceae bacterium]|jgi:CxxC motif-containing protein|nr:DUF1667 domain-containing protein [Eubacteriaceae bacterium]MDD4507685.1 DUF1667 domain-containing protein [Eubacteriaceae bacterium]